MIDEALGFTLAMDPPFLSSALCLPDLGGLGVQHVLHQLCENF
jgi:hypothetical protein